MAWHFGYNIPCQQRRAASDKPNNGDLHSGSAVDSDSTCGSSILSSPTRPQPNRLRYFRGIAQLVARLVRDEEAVGSNPAAPTKKDQYTLCTGLFCLSERDLNRRGISAVNKPGMALFSPGPKLQEQWIWEKSAAFVYWSFFVFTAGFAAEATATSGESRGWGSRQQDANAALRHEADERRPRTPVQAALPGFCSARGSHPAGTSTGVHAAGAVGFEQGGGMKGASACAHRDLCGGASVHRYAAHAKGGFDPDAAVGAKDAGQRGVRQRAPPECPPLLRKRRTTDL